MEGQVIAAPAQAAALAFAATREWPPARHGDLLEAVIAELGRDADALVAVADEETGLGPARLRSEFARTAFQLQMFADLVRSGAHLEVVIDTAQPDSALFRPDVRRMLVPLGPVAVFGASNFPFAFGVPGGDTASALAAGCPVVVKAHPAQPRTSRACAHAIYRAVDAAGFPAGTFALVEGGEAASRELVTAPEIRAVGFTGSLRGGRALFDLAAARPDPIPVYAEMGSLNPVFVLPAALRRRPEAIARGFVDSMTLSDGQFCTKPGLVVLSEGPEADVFRKTVEALISARTSGRLIHAGIAGVLDERLARSSSVVGVEVMARGRTAAADGRPAVILSVSAAALLAAPELFEEQFGPVALVAGANDPSELEAVARALPGSLTATVHGEPEDHAQARPLLGELAQRAGRLVWNGFPTGVAVGPATHHGGPYPATTSVLHTSVGTGAIRRFLRPVAWQGMPPELLPEPLQGA